MKVTVKVGFRAETSSDFPLTFYRIQERKCILKETSEKRGRMNVTKNIGQPFLFGFFFCLFFFCLSRPYKIHLYCHIQRMCW